MQVVTVSGFKGGTGKTTVASLLGVAAVKDGLRVACLDLDANTRNLSAFLMLRRAAKLAAPDHVLLMDAETPGKPKPRHSGRLEPLVRMARMDGYDLLIIDTSSGNLADVYEAHLLADIVLTPMNESPADMHGLFATVGSVAAPKVNYREMIETVRFDRRRAGLPEQHWHVIMNRVTSMPSRVTTAINERVERLASEAGFEKIWKLRDRVAHRGLALDGYSVFDEPAEGKLSMSDLSGRAEVRALLTVLNTPAMPQRIAA